MKIMTKKFWSNIENNWPGEWNCFNDWLKKFKELSECDDIFNPKIPDLYTLKSEYIGISIVTKTYEIYEFPDAIQIGIFLQYTIEEPSRFSFIIQEDETIEGIIKSITEWFAEEHCDAVREHSEEKYGDMDSQEFDEY